MKFTRKHQKKNADENDDMGVYWIRCGRNVRLTSITVCVFGLFKCIIITLKWLVLSFNFFTPQFIPAWLTYIISSSNRIPAAPPLPPSTTSPYPTSRHYSAQPIEPMYRINTLHTLCDAIFILAHIIIIWDNCVSLAVSACLFLSRFCTLLAVVVVCYVLQTSSRFFLLIFIIVRATCCCCCDKSAPTKKAFKLKRRL